MDTRSQLERWLAQREEVLASQQQVLAALDRRIVERHGSRRRFFREVLPQRIITDMTWGRWVSGADTPRAAHLQQLLPLFQEYLGLADGKTALDDDGVSADEGGAGGFCLRDAPLDVVVAIAAAAIAEAMLADLAERPEEAHARRRRAITLLGLLSELAESEDWERMRLGAVAAATLAFLLAHQGEHGEARRHALTAAYVLESLGDTGNSLNEPMTFAGYQGWTYRELIPLSYARAGEAADMLGRPTQAEQRFRQAIQVAAGCPKSDRMIGGVSRSLTATLLRQGRLEEARTVAALATRPFAPLRVWDDPILYYVGLDAEAGVHLAAGRLADARSTLERAEAVGALARLGPTHRLLLLRRRCEAHFAARELDSWLAALTAATDLAEASGLRGELRRLRTVLQHRTTDLPEAVRFQAVQLCERLQALASQGQAPV